MNMNRKFSLITVVLLGIFLVGCDQPAETAKKNKGLEVKRSLPQVEPGIFDKSVVSSTGEIVRYTVAIPKTYDPEKPTPLIVALHFGGRVTPHYARGIVQLLVLPGLAELNAIVIAPDSIAGGWNNDKNEAMVLELMDYAATLYNVDKEKTLLTGFSMGGHGTWYVGSRNQDRFSAMIPIAGSPRIDPDLKGSTPIYVIHSKADEVVPIGPTEDYVAAQKAIGNEDVEFVVVDDLPHFETARFAEPLKQAVPWVQKIWGTVDQ